MDHMFMDAPSSDEDVHEMREFEAAAMERLKSEVLVFPDADMNYRCPFCASQELQLSELYYHAQDVGVGTRGSETRGQHRALSKFVQEIGRDTGLIHPRVVKLLQAAPNRVRAENRVVYPWVGLIYNLNTVELDGQKTLPGTGELRDKFSHFQPQQVETFWAYNGLHPEGVAALVFGRDMKAYANCRSFEASFQAVHRGRSDWERCKAAGREGADPDLYGWMAVEDDYYDAGEAGQFLRNKYQVTTMHDVVEEKMKTGTIQKLKKQVELEGEVDQQKEMLSRAEAENLRLSIELLTRKGPSEQALWRELEMHLLEARNQEEGFEAEESMQSGKQMEAAEQASNYKTAELEGFLLEEMHRQDTESLSAGSQRTLDLELHNQQMEQPARELDAEMASLQVGYEDITTKESQNEAGTNLERLEFGKPEKQKQLEIVTNSTD